jgi:hypothetical protein
LIWAIDLGGESGKEISGRYHVDVKNREYILAQRRPPSFKTTTARQPKPQRDEISKSFQKRIREKTLFQKVLSLPEQDAKGKMNLMTFFVPFGFLRLS